VGFWKNTAEVRAMWKCETTFTPQMDGAEREALLAGWHKAVGRSRSWAE
jgi:glycerol kinase